MSQVLRWLRTRTWMKRPDGVLNSFFDGFFRFSTVAPEISSTCISALFASTFLPNTNFPAERMLDERKVGCTASQLTKHITQKHSRSCTRSAIGLIAQRVVLQHARQELHRQAVSSAHAFEHVLLQIKNIPLMKTDSCTAGPASGRGPGVFNGLPLNIQIHIRATLYAR